jgi:hypothetical protein
VLQRPFAYFDGLVDVDDVVFGPGMMIPTDADPKDVMFPIPLQDIPASSYQEEMRLQGDIMRVTGINDMESGAGDAGQQQTATGAQLVHAAANVRIANKTMLLVSELVTPQAEMMLALFQQKVTSTTYIPGPPKPGTATRRGGTTCCRRRRCRTIGSSRRTAARWRRRTCRRSATTRRGLWNMFGRTRTSGRTRSAARAPEDGREGLADVDRAAEPQYPQHVAQAAAADRAELEAAGPIRRRL